MAPLGVGQGEAMLCLYHHLRLRGRRKMWSCHAHTPEAKARAAQERQINRKCQSYHENLGTWKSPPSVQLVVEASLEASSS